MMGRSGGAHSIDPAWRAVLLRDPCVYCYGQAAVLDHVIPALRGGPDEWENRAPCCDRCDEIKACAGPVMMLVATLRARKITGRRFYRSPNERAAAFRMICMKLCRKGMFYNLRVSSLPGDEATHG